MRTLLPLEYLITTGGLYQSYRFKRASSRFKMSSGIAWARPLLLPGRAQSSKFESSVAGSFRSSATKPEFWLFFSIEKNSSNIISFKTPVPTSSVALIKNLGCQAKPINKKFSFWHNLIGSVLKVRLRWRRSRLDIRGFESLCRQSFSPQNLY